MFSIQVGPFKQPDAQESLVRQVMSAFLARRKKNTVQEEIEGILFLNQKAS